MLHAPRYGYGKNMNPCIDCHTLMLKVAGRRMEEEGADFVFTGEVLGQRPMSQGKQSLYVVAKNAGYPDRILRPPERAASPGDGTGTRGQGGSQPDSCDIQGTRQETADGDGRALRHHLLSRRRPAAAS